MTVNIPLLRKGVEWVEEQDALPEIDRKWMQRDWMTVAKTRATILMVRARGEGPGFSKQAKAVAQHCGTAYCLAGYIAQSIEPRYATATGHHTVEGVHVSRFAAEQLGISHNGSQIGNKLFAPGNTAADIRRIAEELAGEPL